MAEKRSLFRKWTMYGKLTWKFYFLHLILNYFCIWFKKVNISNLIWKCYFLQSDGTKLLSCLYFDPLEPGHHLLIWSFQVDCISVLRVNLPNNVYWMCSFSQRETLFWKKKKIFIDWKVWNKIIGLATNLMIILLSKEIHFKTKSLWRIQNNLCNLFLPAAFVNVQ